MGTNNEEKINKLLDFPYDAFLMVRLEYVQILGDELEAKLLRIIEKYIDIERRRIYQQMANTATTANGQVVEITKDVWVAISHRLFMNDLFGTVTSENTIKKALKEMVKKRIIFQRYTPKQRYDAPEYKIHVNVLQTLLGMLPNPGCQKLIPSFIDTLKKLPPQELTPSECQKLIPLVASRVSKIDTNITEITNNSNDNREESNGAHFETDASLSSHTLDDSSKKKPYTSPSLTVHMTEKHERIRPLVENNSHSQPGEPCGHTNIDLAHLVPTDDGNHLPSLSDCGTQAPLIPPQDDAAPPAVVTANGGRVQSTPPVSHSMSSVPPLTLVPPKEKSSKKLEAPPKCDPAEVRRRINAHRGYALEEKVEIIRENQAIKTWASLHTLDEYDLVMEGLKRDPYWGKPENLYRIGGLVLLRETSRILGERARQCAGVVRDHGTVSGKRRLLADDDDMTPVRQLRPARQA